MPVTRFGFWDSRQLATEDGGITHQSPADRSTRQPGQPFQLHVQTCKSTQVHQWINPTAASMRTC